MVNRIWQHHFGEGLVRTPNDFGERGERPTHPELLDYLAARFVESGWSVKAMHRLIMLSADLPTEQQRRRRDAGRDPDNRLFGRMNRRRLDAEAIRDSLLAVSGRLDATRGGPPFTDLAVPRRTLYLMSARTGANTSDFGRLFDRADPSLIVAQARSVGRRTAGALLPQRPVRDTRRRRPWPRGSPARPRQTTEARISHLYALALGRPPTEGRNRPRSELLAAPVGRQPTRWNATATLILCTNEFLYVD